MSEEDLMAEDLMTAEGSLGGVQRFAQAQRIKPKEAQEALQKILSYTLISPDVKSFQPCLW